MACLHGCVLSESSCSLLQNIHGLVRLLLEVGVGRGAGGSGLRGLVVGRPGGEGHGLGGKGLGICRGALGDLDAVETGHLGKVSGDGAPHLLVPPVGVPVGRQSDDFVLSQRNASVVTLHLKSAGLSGLGRDLLGSIDDGNWENDGEVGAVVVGGGSGDIGRGLGGGLRLNRRGDNGRLGSDRSSVLGGVGHTHRHDGKGGGTKDCVLLVGFGCRSKLSESGVIERAGSQHGLDCLLDMGVLTPPDDHTVRGLCNDGLPHCLHERAGAGSESRLNTTSALLEVCLQVGISRLGIRGCFNGSASGSGEAEVLGECTCCFCCFVASLLLWRLLNQCNLLAVLIFESGSTGALGGKEIEKEIGRGAPGRAGVAELSKVSGGCGRGPVEDSLSLREEEKRVEKGKHRGTGGVHCADNSASSPCKIDEDLQSVVRSRCIETGGGFIEEDQLRVVNQFQSDGHSLLLSPRNSLLRVTSHEGVSTVPQTEFLHDRVHSLNSVLLLDIAKFESGSSHQSFLHSQVVEEVILLHHIARECPGVAGCDTVVEDLPGSVGVAGGDAACHQVQESGLSATGGAHNGQKLSGLRIEVDVVDDVELFLGLPVDG
mmetsp:Transcript_32914/g.65169  ORF Transcript_32914/g.65169 Transcript_32914/m.65169 type:complete len:600 (+) Transcript_32914:61-1860(+)